MFQRPPQGGAKDDYSTLLYCHVRSYTTEVDVLLHSNDESVPCTVVGLCDGVRNYLWVLKLE